VAHPAADEPPLLGRQAAALQQALVDHELGDAHAGAVAGHRLGVHAVGRERLPRHHDAPPGAGHPQPQVVVVAAGGLRGEAAHALERLAAEQRPGEDRVLADQALQGHGIAPAEAVRPGLVAVAVRAEQPRVAADDADAPAGRVALVVEGGHPLQEVLAQQVVVVEQRDQLAVRRLGDRPVAGAHDAEVALRRDHAEAAGVLGGVAGGDRARAVRGRVVDQDGDPVRAGLGQDGVQRRLEVGLGVVDGDDDGDAPGVRRAHRRTTSS